MVREQGREEGREEGESEEGVGEEEGQGDGSMGKGKNAHYLVTQSVISDDEGFMS